MKRFLIVIMFVLIKRILLKVTTFGPLAHTIIFTIQEGVKEVNS